MAVFRIQAPDGQVIKIEARDEATALQGAKEYYASLGPKQKPKPNAAVDAVKSFGSRALRSAAEIGQSLPGSNILGAVEQAAGLVAKDSPFHRAAAMAKTASEPRNAMMALGIHHEPQTLPGRIAGALGEQLPNAMLPGGMVRRAASVVLPGAGSAAAGEATRGTPAEPWARAGGAMAGGVMAGVRVGARPPREAAALTKMGRQARPDPAAMRTRAARLRGHGIDPTLADVTDEAGRGVLRATASRMTPARQAAQDFARARSLELPRRMSQQARQHLSNDPRTPQAIAEDLAGGRRSRAGVDFGRVRLQPVAISPPMAESLRHPMGQAAIREAARRERDPTVREALTRLTAQIAEPGAAPPAMTVGMADRISRVLRGQAQSAARTGDNDLAATFGQLADDIRNPVRTAVPDYDAALNNYAAESRVMGAADRGEDFLTRDTDAFVNDIAELGPEGLPVARATARRAVERASGENVAAAPGVARRLATAPEQQARTRALMPEDEARAFEDAMAAEAEIVDSANFIAPRTGSPTAGKTQDALQTAGEGVSMIGSATTGNPVGAALTAAKLWLTRQGLNDREAEALTRLAIDPARTDEAIRLLEQRLGQPLAIRFVEQAGRIAAPAGLTALSGSPAQ